mmetsp:Transcript_17924/g.25212  ORF Transcript_17924/g.25212 Transcript_17924/m.25212 type:complete len:150 (-) Transcript_17924:45-494(-)
MTNKHLRHVYGCFYYDPQRQCLINDTSNKFVVPTMTQSLAVDFDVFGRQEDKKNYLYEPLPSHARKQILKKKSLASPNLGSPFPNFSPFTPTPPKVPRTHRSAPASASGHQRSYFRNCEGNRPVSSERNVPAQYRPAMYRTPRRLPALN